MSNLVQGTTFSLFFTQGFENKEIAQKIVNVLISAPKRVRPRKFGAFPPGRKIENADDVVGVLVNERGPKSGPRAGSLIMDVGKDCGFQAQWNKSAEPSFPFIGGHLMFAAIAKDGAILDDFIGVVRTLVGTLKPVYGEVRSMAVKGWDTPVNLTMRLPDVPPISIYGKEYIDLFGKDKIERAPFLSITPVGECYWLTAHDSVMEEVPDARRESIRNYLGEDSFVAGGKRKYTHGHAPKFNLSHLSSR